MMSSSKEQLFRDVVASLDRADHRMCVFHGDKDHSERFIVKKDVDVVSENPAQVPRILTEGKVASIVRAFKGAQNTLYTLYLYRQHNGKPIFLELDFWSDCRRRGYVFFSGKELLKARKPFEYFDVLAPEFDFTCALIKGLVEGLDQDRTQRLSELYSENPSGCTKQLSRFLPASEVSLIAGAASSADWEPVVRQREHLRQALLENMSHEQPLGKARFWLSEIRVRVRSCIQPEGLMVTFLGTDGAGKSSVTARVEQDLAPVFSSTKRYHRPVASPLRWMKRFQTGIRSGGHASPSTTGLYAQPAQHDPPGKLPHNLPASLLKLGLWWADFTVFGYLLDVYPRLVGSTLVLLDRYYQDLLVHPHGYRYGGPLWLARLVGRFVPRPHLVILLDAPAEVIQARKPELPFEETARQREAYLEVGEGLSNAHVVDTSQPLAAVVDEVERIILEYMAQRTAQRLEPKKHRSSPLNDL
jgi:thymidylate kinase